MKIKFRLILIVLMCFVLTGCFGTIVNIDIKNDNTGTVHYRIGISENAYQTMKSFETAENVGEVESQLKEMTPFTYNGIKYYGQNQTINFSNIDDFNAQMQKINEEEEMQSGFFTLSKNGKEFVLTLKITSETANTTDSKENMSSFGMSEAEINRLMRDMIMTFSINMPTTVIQTEGDNEGITINGNNIKINFLKLKIPTEQNGTKVYSFTTTEKVVEKAEGKFVDVPTDLWSCKAIETLAEGGLVSGVGNGKFSPERGMKISEFCQVLVNATGLESGSDENGYWAAKAIKSCIDNNYIYSHGEIIPEIYDEVITREEAIAAMQIASGRTAIADKNIQLSDIPDGNEISEQYKELVLQAYNSGITTGVNAQLKFSPKNKLTRGQVCQLFYNVDWTTPIKR